VQPGLTLTPLGSAQFLANLEACVRVYAAAMNPPEQQLPGRQSIMERHAGYRGFRAIAAMSPAAGPAPAAAPEPQLAGFAYGFHGAPGQWWHDLVTGAVASRLGQARAGEWFADAFEIAEVHVLPGYQGRGTGLALMRALTAGRPERTAVLSTLDASTRARRLYRGLGFTDLLTGFAFPGAGEPYAIMGAPLPLPGAAARPARPSRW
jgi:ribosomal protein S18 acetylase RimI-like enzyme